MLGGMQVTKSARKHVASWPYRDDMVGCNAVLSRHKGVVEVASEGPQEVVGDHQGCHLVLQITEKYEQ